MKNHMMEGKILPNIIQIPNNALLQIFFPWKIIIIDHCELQLTLEQCMD